jgi:NADPH:quinone reductase-like Zn-dependent oxidoreductase
MKELGMQGLQLRSLVKEGGDLELSLLSVEVPEPRDDEVMIRVEATPINPSDIGLLTGPADMSAARTEGAKEKPIVTAPIPKNFMRALAARVGQSMPVGNEGAGTVIRAGKSVQNLIGKTVAAIGGAMYSQYRTVRAADCLVLPADATAVDGASSFVNPLTALAMVETMRTEGHVAIVHTAAASNLGQMLVKLCLEEHVPLVNVVRRPDQAALLRDLAAKYVVDTSAPAFFEGLTEAIIATKATIAFDAVGGGELGSQILTAMEIAASKSMAAYSRYGSSTFKQLYIYGMLDTSPTQLTRSFGFAWSVGGFLLTSFLQKIGPGRGAELRARVAAGLRTTFASHYSHTISLAEALDLDVMSRYLKRETGQKYLIDPSSGL